MNIIKTVLSIILGLIIGFGLWYLIGWFVSNQMNPLLCPWYGKIIYLIMGFLASDSMIDELGKKI